LRYKSFACSKHLSHLAERLECASQEQLHSRDTLTDVRRLRVGVIIS